MLRKVLEHSMLYGFGTLGFLTGTEPFMRTRFFFLILETAVCYDCLNVVNLASMEILCRRRQLLAEAHAANPAAPSYEGGDYFLGTGLRAGGALVAPSLSAFVSDKLRADAAVLKEKRKLAEARNLRPATAPKQKGSGKGAEAEK